jgi:diacylglycerol kinase (ATP)
MKIVGNFLGSRIKSIGHALRGLKDILSTEHNAWIHAVSTILSLSLALWLRIDFVEFVLIILVITLVWVAEAFNTVLEIVVNMVSPRYSKVAKRAKDIAAGAVLVAAIGAAMVGLALLLPPLCAKFQVC